MSIQANSERMGQRYDNTEIRDIFDYTCSLFMLTLFVLILWSSGIFYLIGNSTNSILFKETLTPNQKILSGMAIHYGVMGIIQLFTPINLYWNLLITPLLIILNKKHFKFVSNYYILSLIGLTAFLLPLMHTVNHAYDHYLYHDQIMGWFNEYKLIPGLGNIHGRFAFNNSLFVINSSFQLNHESNWYIVNIIFLILFILEVKSWLFSPKFTLTQKSALLGLSASVLFYSKTYISSVSPDFQVLIIVLFAWFPFLTIEKEKLPIKFLVSILLFSITVKLNMAPFSVLLILYLLYSQLPITTHKENIKTLSIPIFIGLVWILRSMILSGQPLYPLPALYLSATEHAVSKTQVEYEKVCVTGWAQSPGDGFEKRYQENKNSLKWVPNWYKIRLNDLHSVLPIYGNVSVRYVLLFVLLASLSCVLSIKSFLGSSNKAQLILISALLLNSIYWFVTGPDYRFGFPTFILLLTTLAWKTKENRFPYPVLLFLIACAPYQIWNFGTHTYNHYLNTKLWKENLVTFKDIGKSIPSLDSSYIYTFNKSDSIKYYFPNVHDHTPIDKFPCLPSKISDVIIQKVSKESFKFVNQTRDTK